MKNKYLSNVEVEAMFGLWLISALMVIRGLALLFTPETSIERSDMYTTMNDFLPLQIWGLLFIIAGVVIVSSSVSQSIRKYYGLIVGNVLGAIVGIPFAFISFAESHMTITQHTITLVAFLNLLLVVHSGVVIWRERKRIHSLRE